MSLYVKVQCNFYTHRKTVRLRRLLGDDAFWVPPRLWAYAAKNQPDGCFKDYSADEIALLIGYTKDATSMLQALLQARFIDEETMQIHGWEEHNSYHRIYSERAKTAADTRWGKDKKVVSPPVPPLPKREESTVPELTGASIASSIASSIPEDKQNLIKAKVDSKAVFEAMKAKVESSNPKPLPPPDEHSKLLAMFYPIFRRDPGCTVPYDELLDACAIVRRPRWRDEAAEMLLWKTKLGPDARYFPHSLGSLLSGWQKFLDQSRSFKPNNEKSRQATELMISMVGGRTQ